jgi:putative nucleotidyltransferase with HDIG domain
MYWKYLDQYDPNYINEHCPWMSALADTPQDPIFHQEGDVATHTFMVLEELQKDLKFQSLPKQEQECLKAAALLHDIEKRSTTVLEENGRITSRGHAKKGAQTVQTMLYEAGNTPFHIREQIVNLVRYHGLPLWIFEKPSPLKALLQCSFQLNTQLLAYLAEADVKGRTCLDKNEMLERVAFFKAYCQEQECWSMPKNFPSDLSRFHFFHKESEYPKYEPFNDLKGEMVILCGLPGAGKDAHIQTHYSDWPVVSLDQLRRKHKIAPGDKKRTGKLVQLAKEEAKGYLRKQIPFVWNATNITRKVRQQLVGLFSPYKAKIRIDYIEVPLKVLLSQNNNREWVVPKKVIDQMLHKLEIPSKDEAHEVEYFIKDNKDEFLMLSNNKR